MSDEQESQEQEQLHHGRFSIIPSAALDDPAVTPALLKLLNVLGTYGGNKAGYCWVKLSTLAGRLGNVSKQAVSKNLQHLRELGYIEIKPRFGTDGRRIRNDYRILFDRPDPYGQKALPEVDGRQLPEVDGGQLPEVDGGQLPEVDALNVSSERLPMNVNSSAAALTYPGRKVDRATPEAAAADDKENALNQTAEAVRRHLRMSREKLPGLRLIIAQYPASRRPWLENQANLCFETLKVRPLQLNHFSNWLDEDERRRTAPREDMTHEASTNNTHTTHADPATAERHLSPQAAGAADDGSSFRSLLMARLADFAATAQRGGAGTVPAVPRDDDSGDV